MKSTKQSAQPYSVFISAGLFVALVAAGLIALAPFPKSSGDFAAWIQGVGTVVALFIAVGIPIWQVDLRRKERAEAERSIHAVARRLAEAVIGTLENSAGAFGNIDPQNRPFIVAHLVMIERMSTAMVRFPVQNLIPDAALTMIHVQSQLAAAELALREAMNEPLSDEMSLKLSGRLMVIVAELSSRLPDLDL